MEHRIGEIVSRQKAACGITQILASVLEKKVNPAEEMKISLVLKNTGEVSGTEVVQLYQDLWIEGRERRLYELFIAGMWLCVVCGTGAVAAGSGGGYFTE